MQRIVWNPWKDLERLQSDLGRLFARDLLLAERTQAYPPVNLWQNADGVLLTAEIPGLAADALDITVNPDSVTLRADKPASKPGEGETWNRKERPDASFSRTIPLPVSVDPQSADATYDKGVLTLKLQRPEEHRPKKVVVRAG